MCSIILQQNNIPLLSFSTITEALKAAKNYAPNPITLFLEDGIYEENLIINQPNLTLQGNPAGGTIITGSLGAKELLEDGCKRGTFRTQTVLIDCDHFTARNITFQNTAGIGEVAGQALAVYADGNYLLFEHCSFLGRQDTLFAAPLPLKEVEKGGFRGPKEFAPRTHGTHFYRNCYLEGDIDFIFGGATAYFDSCTICSLTLNQQINGYITAASTPQEVLDGFVFTDCQFISNTCPPSSVYLGRPWRDFAKVAIIHCFLGDHIKPEGWHDWNKKQAHQTACFCEYDNYGPRADMSQRVDWVKKLHAKEAEEILQRSKQLEKRQ
ncbi:MAG: pectinesterase family protein [Lachnospiraceae bacterium]